MFLLSKRACPKNGFGITRSCRLRKRGIILLISRALSNKEGEKGALRYVGKKKAQSGKRKKGSSGFRERYRQKTSGQNPSFMYHVRRAERGLDRGRGEGGAFTQKLAAEMHFLAEAPDGRESHVG